MKSSRNKSKKILALFSIIILLIISSLFFYKSQVTNNKKENNVKTEKLNNEVDNPKGKDTTVKDKSEENQTSVSNKDKKVQEKDQAKKVIKDDDRVTVFVKSANFGSIAELFIDKNDFNSSYKYYQFFLSNKQISNIESITKSETTIFPAQEVGDEVVLKLLDENKEVLKELKIKLNDKK